MARLPVSELDCTPQFTTKGGVDHGIATSEHADGNMVKWKLTDFGKSKVNLGIKITNCRKVVET